jgi:probable O-glycosylation ligase (exosortase A-associated)
LFALVPFSDLVSTSSRYVSGVKGVAAVTLVGFLLSRATKARQEPLVWGRNLLVGLFVAAVGVATLFSLNYEYVPRRLLQFAGALIVYFLCVNLIQSRRDIWLLLRVLVFAGTASALLGILAQVFLGRNLLMSQEAQQQYFQGVRLTGAASYGPNAFALILVTLIPLCAYLFIYEKRLWPRLLFLGSLAVLVVADVLTYSRASVVTLVLIVPYLLFKLRRRFPPRRLALGVAAILLIVVPFVPREFYSRVESLSEGTEDRSLRGRWSYVVTGLHILHDHPLLGVGLGNFGYAFGLPQYSEYAEVSERQFMLGSLRAPGSAETRAAHNMYLEVVTETGLVGFFFFGLLIFVTWRDLHFLPRRLRNDRADSLGWMSEALELSLLAFLVDAAFLHVPYHQYLWMFIAMSAVGHRIALRGEGGDGSV